MFPTPRKLYVFPTPSAFESASVGEHKVSCRTHKTMYMYNQVPSCIYAVGRTKQCTRTARCHHAPPLSASFVLLYECFNPVEEVQYLFRAYGHCHGGIYASLPLLHGCMYSRPTVVMPLPRTCPMRRSLSPVLFGDLTHRAAGHNISVCRRSRVVSRPCLKLSDSYDDPLRRVIAPDNLRISYALLLLYVLLVVCVLPVSSAFSQRS